MRDRLRIQTHSAHLCHSTRVIRGIDGVGQEELGLAFGRIDLDRQDQGRPDQDSPIAGWNEQNCSLTERS